MDFGAIAPIAVAVGAMLLMVVMHGAGHAAHGGHAGGTRDGHTAHKGGDGIEEQASPELGADPDNCRDDSGPGTDRHGVFTLGGDTDTRK
jgi:hypothetical protein